MAGEFGGISMKLVNRVWELQEVQGLLPRQLEAKRGLYSIQKGTSESQLSPASYEGMGLHHLVFLSLFAARDGPGLAEGPG